MYIGLASFNLPLSTGIADIPYHERKTPGVILFSILQAMILSHPITPHPSPVFRPQRLRRIPPVLRALKGGTWRWPHCSLEDGANGRLLRLEHARKAELITRLHAYRTAGHGKASQGTVETGARMYHLGGIMLAFQTDHPDAHAKVIEVMLCIDAMPLSRRLSVTRAKGGLSAAATSFVRLRCAVRCVCP